MKTIDLLTFGGEEVKCVRLSDYEELKAENEQLRAEIERLTALLHNTEITGG